MKIAIIGPGKMGTALGKYLNITPSKNIESLENVDIIFITTPDSEIYGVYKRIKNIKKDTIFIHMSGSLTSEIFENNIGFSVHPMAAVTKETDLTNIMFTIEGNSLHIGKIKALFPNNIIIKKEAKPLYHAAAVIASNFLVGIYNIAESLLKEAGIEDSTMLTGLVNATLHNIKTKGSIEALTGPVERADTDTIKTHLNTIPEDFIEIYKTLSLHLIKIAKEKNQTKDYHQLLRIFHE